MTELEIRCCIENALRSYCRGIDRLHSPSLEAAFHPGAMLVDYGPAPLTIEVFVQYALVSLGKRFVATQHRLSNITVELVGDAVARVESYVLAFHVEDGDGEPRLHTFAGRYIDRFEERDGAWKIARRDLRYDWSTVAAMSDGMTGTWIASGRDGSADPIFD